MSELIIVAGSFGHGGVFGDLGATGKAIELDVNKEVYKEICRQAKKDNLIKIVNCNKEGAWTKSQKENLTYIANKANKSKAVLYFDLHHNINGGTGVEVFAVSDLGRKCATEVCHEVSIALGIANRGVKKEDFIVLNNTVMPAILIEGWFLDSSNDFKKYNCEVEAKAILKGIYDYLKLKKPTIVKDKVYVVVRGDTLYSIARRLGKSVDYLVEKNNILNRNLIFPGTKLTY